MDCVKTLTYAKKKYGRIKYDIKRFCAKLKLIARRLNIPEKWLLAALHIETAGTFDHTIENRYTKAYGLFQCTPSTCQDLAAKGLLSYPQQIKYLDAYQQLELLEKYLNLRLKERGLKKYNSFVQLYLALFWPAAMKFHLRDNFVIGGRNVAIANPAFDLDKDGNITIGEIRKFYKQNYGGIDIDSDILTSLIVAIIKTLV